MKGQNLFCRKIKEKISLSSAESSQTVVKVKLLSVDI